MSCLSRFVGLCRLVFLIALPLLLGIGRQPATSEAVTDPSGFSFTPPAGFTPLPQVKAQQPSVLYAYGRENGAGEAITLVAYERMKGVIGRESLEKFLPADRKNLLSKATWNGFDVEVIEVPEKVNGVEYTTFNVQVPLKPFAIQVKVGGPTARKAELRTLLDATLNGLTGSTNWYRSVVPGAVSNSSNYGTYLLVALIACFIVGLVVLYIIGRMTPPGTVLAIAVVMYMASYAFPNASVRELLMLSGGLRMLAVAAGILGIVDVVRRGRQTPPSAAKKG